MQEKAMNQNNRASMRKRCVTAFTMSAVAALGAHAAIAADTTVIANQEVAVAGRAGDLVLPSIIFGTRGDVQEQVEELTTKIAALLKASDLKISELMRHTIYLKTGSQDPAKTFVRLIGNLRKMGGAELTNNATAGTIVLVPSFPDPAAQIGIELVGGHAPKGMTRTPIMLGSRMSVESIGNEQFVASFGLEGLDFYGTGAPPNKNLDEELEQLVGVLGAVLGHAGLTLANVVSYDFYVTKGTDPVEATSKLHQLMRKRLPDLNQSPSAGTVVVLDGATIPTLRVQLNVIASRSKPETVARVPVGEVPADTAAQSVSAGGAVFVSGVGGLDYEKGGAVADDVASQAEAAARSLHRALQDAGGLKLSDVARFAIYVKQGEDPAAAMAAFYQAVRKIDRSFEQKQAAAVIAMVQGFPRATTKFLVSAVAASK
jgi:enamine deaminase RidA (YjgF/YER057c/UK114 family)